MTRTPRAPYLAPRILRAAALPIAFTTLLHAAPNARADVGGPPIPGGEYIWAGGAGNWFADAVEWQDINGDSRNDAPGDAAAPRHPVSAFVDNAKPLPSVVQMGLFDPQSATPYAGQSNPYPIAALNISDGDQVRLLYGSTLTISDAAAHADPTTDQYFAPAGSLLLNNTGNLLLSSDPALNTPPNFLRFAGSGTIAGGSVTLAGADNYIESANGNAGGTITLFHSTIAGAGHLGNLINSDNVGNAPTSFVNDGGLISANTPGLTLTIQITNDENLATLTNTNGGILRADGNATLAFRVFDLATLHNAGGFLQAVNGGHLTLPTNLTVDGGTLTTDAASSIAADGATLNNVANGGDLALGDAGNILFLRGTFTNAGTLHLNATPTGSGNLLGIDGNVTLAGPGSVLLSDSPRNNIFATANGNTLTVSPASTIRGSGTINTGRVDNSSPNQFYINLVNQGAIVAAGASGLTINLDNPHNANLANAGTLRADASTLHVATFSSAASVSNTGTLEAVNGGTLLIDGGATLSNNVAGALIGGTYAATGPGSTISFPGPAVTSLAPNTQVILTDNGQVLAGGLPITATLISLAGGSLRLQGTTTATLPPLFTSAGDLKIKDPATTLTVPTSFTQNTGGTLSGTGTLTSPSIHLAGTLAPGNSPGTLNLVGDVTLDPAALLNFELASPAGPNDHVNVAGALTLDGILNVLPLPGFTTGTYDLLDFTGLLTDNTLAIGSLPPGVTAHIETTSTSVNLVVTAVPEPAALTLLAAAALPLRRRRRTCL